MIDEGRVDIRSGALTYDLAQTLIVQSRHAMQRMLRILVVDNDDHAQKDIVQSMQVHIAIYIKCIDDIYVPYSNSIVNIDYMSVSKFFRESDDGIMSIIKDEKISISDDNKTQRQLIMITYQELQKRQARIFENMIYFPVYTPRPNVKFTKAFMRSQMTVETFVPTMFGSMMNTALFSSIMATPGVVKSASSFIEVHRDKHYLPELAPVRGTWSFRDGIYDGNTGMFYSYDDEECPITCTMKYIDQSVGGLFQYKTQVERPAMYDRYRLPIHDVQYDRDLSFDIGNPNSLDEEYMTSLPSFLNIRTPLLDQITHLQFFKNMRTEESVKSYMFFLAMLGRMFFKPTSDGFQIIPFLIGAGGTGKSVILSVLRSAFELDLIGDIGPNIEATFGLQSLFEKHLIICSEISKERGLDFATFKQMVANDMVTVNRKNHGTVTVERWDIPMIWSMNELPRYRSDAGALERRIAAFSFHNKPAKTDTNLEKNILNELANIIVKLCEARAWLYREMITNAKTSVQDIMPSQVYQFTNEMMTKLDQCIQFLRSGILIKRAGNQLKWQVIMEELRRYAPNLKKTDDLDLTMETHFKNAGFSVERRARFDDPFGGTDIYVHDVAISTQNDAF